VVAVDPDLSILALAQPVHGLSCGIPSHHILDNLDVEVAVGLVNGNLSGTLGYHRCNTSAHPLLLLLPFSVG